MVLEVVSFLGQKEIEKLCKYTVKGQNMFLRLKIIHRILDFVEYKSVIFKNFLCRFSP